jgi:hypothetical protein
MKRFKGWRTRAFNIFAALIGLASELIPLVPRLTIEPDMKGHIQTGLLLTVLIGNLILREISNTKAGSKI